MQVVPDTVFSFFNTVGSSDSLYSRLMSLRKVISDKDEDNTMQKIGYVLDLFMNTGEFHSVSARLDEDEHASHY